MLHVFSLSCISVTAFGVKLKYDVGRYCIRDKLAQVWRLVDGWYVPLVLNSLEMMTNPAHWNTMKIHVPYTLIQGPSIRGFACSATEKKLN